MPRSASMWAFNVARSLLGEAGLTVFPRVIPKRAEEMREEARKGLRDRSPSSVWCLKVHRLLRSRTPSSRFISTFRDPRDAVISFMRFTRCDFERAVAAAAYWTRICDHYRAMPPELSLSLDYDAIITQPTKVAGQISTFLGLDSVEGVIADVVMQFDRENVRLRIEAAQKEVKRRRAAGDTDIVDSLVVNADRTLRIMDLETGFQSDHVSDYRAGDWRRLLTDDQKQRLDRAIGDWLTQRGYDRHLGP